MSSLIKQMKLKIETIEKVKGNTLRSHWKSPMFVVNGEYFASSIDEHNINGKPFDLKVGENVDVVIDKGNWIARSN